jgi:hypothetical protein
MTTVISRMMAEASTMSYKIYGGLHTLSGRRRRIISDWVFVFDSFFFLILRRMPCNYLRTIRRYYNRAIVPKVTKVTTSCDADRLAGEIPS